MDVKFIKSSSDREVEFEKMIKGISEAAEVSPETVRKFGERALNAYGDKRFNKLREHSDTDKKIEFEYLKQYLYRYMHAIVPAGDKLNHSMRIAENSLKEMFRTIGK